MVLQSHFRVKPNYGYDVAELGLCQKTKILMIFSMLELLLVMSECLPVAWEPWYIFCRDVAKL